MNQTMETVRAWFAPGILIVFLVQAASSLTWVNGIDGRSKMNERDIARSDARISTLEKVGGESSSRMAVMESQLKNVVGLLERIDARMEARSESRP
ncbi:hypothetical protein DYI37_03965 [Fulvimarina endophytica]|uniref:Uncharacterized protein n=1 Tax=Fulvimarina endophytica TaxID=2293836 RepID=A0A371X723_9HYPH|nr:hypothetical protein [Fulvimarina endophytica]RFC65030.1 hypothetical protein DYI37_03965 [Fulvimarina endophytica]